MRDESVPVSASSAESVEPAANSQSALQPITPQPADAQRLTEQDIVGLKYFDELLPLFKRLHDDSCQRDKAGNRTLHYDQYCLMVLLYLFNPICSSLRAVQQASELTNVQRVGWLGSSLRAPSIRIAALLGAAEDARPQPSRPVPHSVHAPAR